MKTLARITLLLGTVGLALGAKLPVLKNLEFAPKEGCKYGLSQAECPVRMECFKDSNYPKGGRCDCNPLWFKIPGPLPFDDSEWDDGFATSDCKNHVFSRFVVGMFFVVGLLMSAAFIHTDIAVLRELKRAKALKWNARVYSLVYMLIASVSILFVNLIYLSNTWGADRNEYWYHSRKVIFSYLLAPFIQVADFEIGVTWIDLYDRTNKMSKSSSRKITALKIFMRTIALFFGFGFLILVMLGGITSFIFAAIFPSVCGGVFAAIAGVLIIRTLCPDKNDISNPNWKVASAIRRGVKHAIGSKILEVISLLGMGFSGKHPVLGYTYGYFNLLYFWVFTLRMWGWLHYLIYGSRKHLKKYASQNASAYFGFSTIGLSQASTRLSRALSARYLSGEQSSN